MCARELGELGRGDKTELGTRTGPVRLLNPRFVRKMLLFLKNRPRPTVIGRGLSWSADQ